MKIFKRNRKNKKQFVLMLDLEDRFAATQKIEDPAERLIALNGVKAMASMYRSLCKSEGGMLKGHYAGGGFMAGAGSLGVAGLFLLPAVAAPMVLGALIALPAAAWVLYDTRKDQKALKSIIPALDAFIDRAAEQVREIEAVRIETLSSSPKFKEALASSPTLMDKFMGTVTPPKELPPADTKPAIETFKYKKFRR